MAQKVEGVETLPSFEEMYREAALLKDKKKRLEEQGEKQKEEKEMKDATFKPKINKYKKIEKKVED